jgi:hypothetical protein
MFEDHWFWRGFQSAVFLYVSCGPCFAAQTQRRRKKEAKRDKKRNAELAEHNLHNGHHPQAAPFEINQHWAEEIKLGPGPPKRRGRGRAATHEKRDINTAGTSSTGGSSLELGRVPSIGSDAKGQYWNSRRYQRADEEYTHFPPVPEHGNVAKQDAMRATSAENNGLTFPTREVQRPKKTYYVPARAPAVSDLHPPATSTVPARKSERAWMTAPPPSVAFMEGRKQVTNRPRSTSARSAGSQLTGINVINTDFGLGKQMGHKVMEDKVRRVEMTREGGRRLTLRGESPSRAVSHSPQRSNTFQERDRTTPRKARRRPVPLLFGSGSSSDEAGPAAYSNETAVHNSPRRTGTAISRPDPTYMPLRTKQHNVRPPYFTTRSSDSSTRTKHDATNNENEHAIPGTLLPPSPSSLTLSRQSSSSVHTRSTSPSPRPPMSPQKGTGDRKPSQRKRKDTKIEDSRPRLFVKDSSLRVLQDVVEPSALLNSNWIRSPTIEAKIPLPRERDDSLTDEWFPDDEQDYAPQVRQSCEF